MTNTNVTIEKIGTLGGPSSSSGLYVGYIASAAKAAQNDTWTALNAKTISRVFAQVDATGVAEGNTISTNVVTLTSATTGNCSGFVVYKEY